MLVYEISKKTRHGKCWSLLGEIAGALFAGLQLREAEGFVPVSDADSDFEFGEISLHDSLRYVLFTKYTYEQSSRAQETFRPNKRYILDPDLL